MQEHHSKSDTSESYRLKATGLKQAGDWWSVPQKSERGLQKDIPSEQWVRSRGLIRWDGQSKKIGKKNRTP
jgi:hypothetical protein